MGIYREGFGGNSQLSFNKKNAFGNSEILNFTFSGGFENLKQIDENDFKIGSNIGPKLSLTFPRLFMFPQITKSIVNSGTIVGYVQRPANDENPERWSQFNSILWMNV